MNSDELRQLREMLPRGSRGQIKESTSFSYSYIDQVLNGRRYNLEILDKALDILRKMLLSQKSTSTKFQQIRALINVAR